MTQTNDILQAVPDTLTEEPISFSLDILPRNKWHKWAQENKYLSRFFPKKKEYSIRPITYANLERISKLLAGVDLEGLNQEATVNEIGMPLLAQHGDLIPKAVAIAIANSRRMPPASLVEEIKYNLTPKESLVLVLIVLKQMDVQSFLHTIVYFKGMRLHGSEKKNDERSAASLQK